MSPSQWLAVDENIHVPFYANWMEHVFSYQYYTDLVISHILEASNHESILIHRRKRRCMPFLIY